jgi:hypothetical protein
VCVSGGGREMQRTNLPTWRIERGAGSFARPGDNGGSVAGRDPGGARAVSADVHRRVHSDALTQELARGIAARRFFRRFRWGHNGANAIGSNYSFPGTYTVRHEALRAVYMDLSSEIWRAKISVDFYDSRPRRPRSQSRARQSG